MRTIVVSEHLKEFGIDVLTGEADALSMRLLCELDEPMMKTYLFYTGFHINIDQLPKSQYNNRERYSCFLTREVMEDLIIMRLMEDNEQVIEILPVDNGAFSGQKFLLAGTVEEMRTYCADHFENGTGSFYKIGRSYHIYCEQPRVGFSNVSAFTGIHQ
jgi:hypothetical protein